jgi:beta-phosphoglucomutase-like phosphatase (HAD superfamily)
VAVEDAANGVRSALAAGLHVVVVPNPHYPPPATVLSKADAVLASLDELDVALVDGLAGDDARERRLDEAEEESFPASDPHSDWAGPPA